MWVFIDRAPPMAAFTRWSTSSISGSVDGLQRSGTSTSSDREASSSNRSRSGKRRPEVPRALDRVDHHVDVRHVFDDAARVAPAARAQLVAVGAVVQEHVKMGVDQLGRVGVALQRLDRSAPRDFVAAWHQTESFGAIASTVPPFAAFARAAISRVFVFSAA
ncbi:MAG: hypothetical protein KBB21_36715, partial [Nannocystaceae bacterium]|nr:hypothetical protein [Nannocystaceae bacterium]